MRFRSGTTAFPGWHRTLALCIAGCFGFISAADWPIRPAGAQAVPAGTTSAMQPQPVTTLASEGRLTQPQLEQLLAPIALYPDELLAQMLMAATYPLELVQAQRWLGHEGHASLRGEVLAQALQSQPWDASVKSLVPFPDVLKMMNDQLDWTQQLGDAVLAQQQDVLNAVQVLRGRARQAGKLQSGPQQTITISQNVSLPPQPAPQVGGAPSDALPAGEAAAPAVAPPPQIITIESPEPDKVYVPSYNPSVVYGSWPYPSYPPAYYPPPVGWGVGNALLTGMAFAGGVALVGSLWGWAGCGWNSGDININSSRIANIDRSRTGDIGNRWQHNSAHRQGVAYRGDQVRNRYQGNRPDRSAQREQFRGRVQQTSLGASQQGGAGERGGLGDRGGPGGRGGLGDRGGRGDRGGAGRTDRPGAQSPRSAGAGRGAGDRAALSGGGPSGSIGHAQSGRPRGGAQSAAPGQSGSRARGAQGFQGIGQGADVRAASQRGQASRQSQPTSFASAGGGRAAGASGFSGGGARAASAGSFGGGGSGGRAVSAGGGGRAAGGGGFGGGRGGGGGGGRRGR